MRCGNAVEMRAEGSCERIHLVRPTRECAWGCRVAGLVALNAVLCCADVQSGMPPILHGPSARSSDPHG